MPARSIVRGIPMHEHAFRPFTSGSGTWRLIVCSIAQKYRYSIPDEATKHNLQPTLVIVSAHMPSISDSKVVRVLKSLDQKLISRPEWSSRDVGSHACLVAFAAERRSICGAWGPDPDLVNSDVRFIMELPCRGARTDPIGIAIHNAAKRQYCSTCR